MPLTRGDFLCAFSIIFHVESFEPSLTKTKRLLSRINPDLIKLFRVPDKVFMLCGKASSSL